MIKTIDGMEVECRLSGGRPPDFGVGGWQCGLRTYVRIGPDWYLWDDRPIRFHQYREYLASGLFTAQELLDYADGQLEKQ